MKEVTLLGEGNRLSNGATVSKKLTKLVEGATEACGSLEVSKATHGIITLFDPPMILFYEIVEIAVGLVENITAKRDAGWHVDRSYARPS